MDWSRVKELQDDLGAEDFEEIIALFLEEVEERLSVIAAGDFSSFADDLHFLKGSAANLGFETFRAACCALEESKDTSATGSLHGIYTKTKSEFLAGLNTQLAG